MALDSETSPLRSVVGSLALFLIILGSSPAALSLVRHLFRRTTAGHRDERSPVWPLYSDEDGQATQESFQRFSNRWQRFVIAFLSAVGFAVSLARAIISNKHLGKDSPIELVQRWLQFGIWTLIPIQAVALCTESAPIRIYSLSRYTFWSGIVIILTLGFNNWERIWSGRTYENSDAISTWLLIGQISAAFLQVICCSLIPRRPNVFHEGKIVDQQFSVSLANRYTFTWANALIRSIIQNKTFNLDDQPCLPLSRRTQTLHTRFEQLQGSRKLWKVLIRAHWRSLSIQCLLSSISSALSFGPQVALYRVLELLQDRPLTSTEEVRAWIWVITLGVLVLLSLAIDAWVWWVAYSEIAVPISAELSALVFAKSMRCKDINPSGSSADKPTGDEGDDKSKESRRKIVNHVAVDVRRVSDFAAFIHLIPFLTLKLILSCTFMVALIGWESLLAGLAIAALVIPVNIFLGKGLSTAQRRVMKASDKRIAMMTEVLKGVRHVKFSAMEPQWQAKINEKRDVELHWLWKSSCYTAGLTAAWLLGPLLLSVISLTTYALIHGGLTASVAFTAISLFGSLEKTLADLPGLFSRCLEAKIAADRIDNYMKSLEKKIHTSPTDAISFKHATVAWPVGDVENASSDLTAYNTEGRFILRDLNLRFPPRGLSLVTGRTASGKSLLLASIIGECDVIAGKVVVPHSPSPEDRFDIRATPASWIIDSAVAYVPQIPWIENATIKDNILFGLPYHPSRYEKVLFACRLQTDLAILPDGDLTDLGANGINLSGGQRCRISFARALYSRAGILVLDDIFSALDAHTAHHVYEHALNGELGEKRTRVLVTHHVSLCLPNADYCVLLEEGSMKYAGPAERFLNHESPTVSQLPVAETDDATSHNEDAGLVEDLVIPFRRSETVCRTEALDSENSSTPKKFSEDERLVSGSIPLSVYMTYLTKGKHLPLWVLALAAYAIYTILTLGRSWWINIWSGSSRAQVQFADYPTIIRTAVIDRIVDVKVYDDLFFYLGVYVAISLFACVVGAVRYFVLVLAALKSSQGLFHDMVYAVLRAPLHWLDTVPLGRILNRFTSDLYMIDVRLSNDLGNFVSKLFDLLSILAACTLISLPLTGIACLLLIICIRISLTFLAAARVIKRLESVARSPVLELIDSSLGGLTTIRTYAKTEDYIRKMYPRLDRHAEASWNTCLLNRWLGYRLAVIGSIFSTATAAVAVYFPTISAAMAGLSISIALQYNFALTMTLRLYSTVELCMNATERVVEYCNVETESQDGLDPPAAWPAQGRIEVCDLKVGYAPDLPPVLNGLSFTIDEGQRVGIVGRTGAGKSSLALALFRFLEARGGYIAIDGLDTSKLKLHALRSRLAIIPQDPVLFPGTIRSNLDPFDEHSDTELYYALEQVQLIPPKETLWASCSPGGSPINEIDRASLSSRAETGNNDTGSSSPATSVSDLSWSIASPCNIKKAPTFNHFVSLSTPVSEGGFLSQGQRQLLCLARAIVSRPKILVLDEATSAVDMETDAVMQRCIRTEFACENGGTTLLVIAHRLSTVADFDRILVMDKGRAVEFGSPKDLIGIDGGVFRNLVDHSGERASLEDIMNSHT